MPTGAVRAAYIYDYMSQPSLGTGAPQTNHIADLSVLGINNVLIKVLEDTPTSLAMRYWKNLRARALSLNMTPWPVFNYQNDYYRNRFSTSTRRYQVTASSSSVLVDPVTGIFNVACPCDPLYIRAMLTNGIQRLPQTPNVVIDTEFPTSPGGFHNYVRPCHCNGCRLDYFRNLNCPGLHCSVDPTTVVLPGEPADPADPTLIAFQQGLHQSLVTQYAKQASYQNIGILDSDASDIFIPYTVAGLLAAGKSVTVFSERTYSTGGPVAQSYPGAAIVGGLWLEKWSPANLQTQITTTMGPGGYFLFTTFSFWLGQTAINSTAAPYDLPLGTIAAYQTAITAANA